MGTSKLKNIGKIGQNQKILLALNPKEEGGTFPSANAIGELKRLARLTKREIQPICLVPQSLERISSGAWVNRSDVLEKKLKKFLQRMKLKAGGTTTFATELAPNATIDETVHALLSQAKKVNARMIALSSHGRSGISRLMSGSFAETLLARSHIPVLVLPSSKHNTTTHFSRVLFPTDFSAESRKTFSAFLKEIQPLHPTILLYHALLLPLDTAIGEMHYSADNQWIEQSRWARKESVLWMQLAQKSGVKMEVLLEENVINLSEAIRRAVVKNKIGLLGVRENRGQVEASLLGSHARELFRSGERACLVYGPSALRDVPMRKLNIKKAA